MRRTIFEVHVGCMWSGKTEAAVAKGRMHQVLGQRVAVFRHVNASRGDEGSERSRTGSYLPDVTPILLADVQLPQLLELGLAYDCIIVEEGHFLPETVVPILEQLRAAAKSVLFAGLDSDWRGKPFVTTVQMMTVPEADVIKHRAICSVCGDDATRSQKIVNGSPAPFTDQPLDAGDSEKYRPVCRNCFLTTYISAGMQHLVLPQSTETRVT